MKKYSPGALKNYELLSMVLGKGTRKEGLFGIARRVVDELKNEFQRCHDAIWQGGKLDSAQAFDEMSKLLFTKYFDELWYTDVGEYYGFQVGSGEGVTLADKRIREIFDEARKRREKVFVEGTNIPDLIIYKVAKLLERSLL